MNKEKEILSYMEKLGLSREEAEQLWEDDNSDEILPEVAEMEAKAKANGRRYENDKSKRKTVKRERKVDEEKKYLLSEIVKVVDTIAIVENVKTETEIAFKYNDSEYTLKLTKHRKKSDK